MTLVDTNILLDLATNEADWADWSIDALSHASKRGRLFINDVVYAEFSVRYQAVEQVDAFIAISGLELAPIPRHALFQAGKAFERYKKAGGTRTGVLPDFFIGAHAEASNLPLLTRDARRYRTYFPSVRLITPEG